MKVLSKFLSIFMLMVFLIGCGASDTPDPIIETIDPEVNINERTVALIGQIEGWNQSDKNLVATFAEDGAGVVAKTPIDANGKFSLTLDEPKDLSKTTAFSLVCNPEAETTSQSDVSISQPTSSKLLGLTVEGSPSVVHLSSEQGFSNIFNVAKGTSATNVGIYYFTNDSVVSGEEACLRANSEPIKVSYDLDIKEGWNRLVLTGTYQNDAQLGQVLTISGKISPVPDNVSWFSRN